MKTRGPLHGEDQILLGSELGLIFLLLVKLFFTLLQTLILYQDIRQIILASL